MNKKIIVFLMIAVLLFSVTSCSKPFDYEEAMDEAMDTMQNATKVHTYSKIVFNDDFGEKIIELSELSDKNDLAVESPEEVKKMASILTNMDLVVEQKADLDNFIIEMGLLLNYESEKFIDFNMFINDEFVLFNEPDLLKQGAMMKFDFLNEMMSQMSNPGNNETIDLVDVSKKQISNQQKMNKKLYKIINQIIEDNLSDPEVLETTIQFNGKDLKTNEVKYSMDYVEALELVKVFLDNEEFISSYQELLISQTEYMSTMSGSMPMQSDEEIIKEFNEGIDEAKLSIDEVLADTEVIAVLENQELDVSYYFDDGIKSIKYDFDFFSIKNDYYSINEELSFDVPTEEGNYAIEDQMGLYGIMGIVNQEAVENLQEHKLVTDFMELQEIPEY